MAILSGKVFEVYWDESSAAFMLAPENEGAELLDVLYWDEFEESDGYYGFVVCSNIHDNPELLKGGNAE